MSNSPTSPPSCPFCRKNNLLQGPLLAHTPGAYLIHPRDDTNNYLIIPEMHCESLLDLPDNWWDKAKNLLTHIPNLSEQDHNLSVNIGPLAGQSVKHIHFWVIPRHPNQPASGIGLAKLITATNQE